MYRLIVLTTTLLGLLAGTAQANVSAGDASFAERVEVDGETLTLAGAGVIKYRIIFTVYGAALYVPNGTAPESVLSAQTPKRLDIEYFYEITPQQIMEGANTILDRQLDPEERQAVDERLRRFQGWFEAVGSGDRYTMIYRPGEGTTLLFNGQEKGTVEGADFAAAYFGIWLAEDSLSDRLKNDLTARLKN